MKSVLYKKRENKMVSGVCSGIADKFGWDLPLTRVLTAAHLFLWLWSCTIHPFSHLSSLQRRHDTK